MACKPSIVTCVKTGVPCVLATKKNRTAQVGKISEPRYMGPLGRPTLRRAGSAAVQSRKRKVSAVGDEQATGLLLSRICRVKGIARAFFGNLEH